MVKAVFNVAEFTKSMLYNCIKVVRLKHDQPNQWLWACTRCWEKYHHLHVCKLASQIHMYHLAFTPLHHLLLMEWITKHPFSSSVAAQWLYMSKVATA